MYFFIAALLSGYNLLAQALILSYALGRLVVSTSSYTYAIILENLLVLLYSCL